MGSVRSVLFPFSAVLLWLLVLVQVDAQSRVEEVQVLTSFRKEMETSSFDFYGYWKSWNENDENACAWIGVTCSTNYTVAALDFSNWGLYYLVNLAALSKLPDLRQLDMSSNTLSGTYSSANSTRDFSTLEDIGYFTELTRLDFSDNQFFGSIPQNISNCRSLRYLSLSGNRFSGTIPDMSELVHLQFLLLADNGLSGSFPKELGALSSLFTIDVSRNNLTGRIPSLVNATSLRNLLLDNNSFVGFEEPMIINAPNLVQLLVSENQLEGIIPIAITKLSSLATLNMSRNSLSGKIPSGLWSKVTSTDPVASLDLSQNQLSGSIPIDLLRIPSNNSVDIWLINLSYNLLSGSIPTPRVTNNETVYVGVNLDLSHNQLTGPIPPQPNGFCYLVLNLGHNLLSGDIVDVLIATTGVNRVFNFSGYEDGGPFGGAFFLYLENNHFTGDLSNLTFYWANWSTPIAINLSNNNLSWTASESIPDPVGAALPYLGGIPSPSFDTVVSAFRVGGNNFSGTPLPLGPLSQVAHLQVLDFGNTQLEGVISGNVFNGLWMPNLTVLNLSNNLASGPIPENITTLFSLTSLDLSNNKLSGALPSIPPNSSLVNPSIYFGNAGLCGYPLPQCPQLYAHYGTGVQWWILLIIVGGSITIAIGSCLFFTWRWRVYHKRHEQDADLIRTLMERELVTLMPLRNLKKATNNFAESARIGEGGFGTVYVGKLNDGSMVAIKRSKREGSEKDKEQFLNEVRILSQVNHRHLVKLMGCCMENKVALLIFEFVSNGTLQEHLQGKIGDGFLSWKQRLDIALQTADALNYLHSATMFPIYHRDVKSANILLSDDLSAKVADFGISKLAPMNATHVSTALQGTMGYIDPEYWVSFQLTEKSDVYSFGVVLLELISAKLAVDFQRGGDETSLVIFATPHIASENLQPLIDPCLMVTYNELHGNGKESILDVGRLAMKCVNMQSKFRPTMKAVWKELQDLCLKLNGTLMNEDLDSLNSSGNENPQADHEIFLSQHSFGDSSNSVLHSDERSFELQRFSRSSKFA